MGKPIVQLLTVKQWLTVDDVTRITVLKNIKLKERLAAWMEKNAERPPLTAPTVTECNRCGGSGEVIAHPRLPGLHPSQIGHPCMLRIYNQMIGLTEDRGVNFRTQLIFDLGSAVHLMFQKYGLKGAWGPYYKPEATIDEKSSELAYELLIDGSADAENILVIDDHPDVTFEVGIIHEYKTINDANFKKLTSPKPEHKQQAMIYSACLDRPVVVYVYLNKNDSTITEFPVGFDLGLWAIIESKAKKLNQFYDAREPPPGTVGFHCKDCGFSKECSQYQAMKGSIQK